MKCHEEWIECELCNSKENITYLPNDQKYERKLHHAIASCIFSRLEEQVSEAQL